MINDVLVQMSIYASMILAGMFLANVLGGAIWFKVFRVRMGGGKKVLLKIHGVTGPYWGIGKLEGKTIKFKIRNSKNPGVCTLNENDYIQRFMNVPYLEIYEDGRVVTRDFKVVSGHDPELVENLMTRIAMLPKRPGLQEILILVALGVIVIGVLYIGYQQSKMAESIKILVEASQVAAGVVPVSA